MRIDKPLVSALVLIILVLVLVSFITAILGEHPSCPAVKVNQEYVKNTSEMKNIGYPLLPFKIRFENNRKEALVVEVKCDWSKEGRYMYWNIFSVAAKDKVVLEFSRRLKWCEATIK